MALEQFNTAQLATLLPTVYRTAHLRIHYRPGTFAAAHIAVFAADAEAAIAHIEHLLGVTWTATEDYYLAYGFFPAPDLGVRGYTRSPYHTIIQMYDGSGTRLERQYSSTHELTHQIAYDTIGQAASTMLLEGLAMYDGQHYLIQDGDISLDGLSRAALQQGRLLSLDELTIGGINYIGRFFYRRPYDEAGSFVQYLINTYGLAAFRRVYVTGDYVSVYGKSLEVLDGEWRHYLLSERAVGPLAADSARYFNGLTAVQTDYLTLFNLLAQGRAVSAQRYAVLDAARIAADRGQDTTVDVDLHTFEHMS